MQKQSAILAVRDGYGENAEENGTFPTFDEWKSVMSTYFRFCHSPLPSSLHLRSPERSAIADPLQTSEIAGPRA
jgi:hypothetical protein